MKKGEKESLQEGQRGSETSNSEIAVENIHYDYCSEVENWSVNGSL